jgi:hypothetical protein
MAFLFYRKYQIQWENTLPVTDPVGHEKDNSQKKLSAKKPGQIKLWGGSENQKDQRFENQKYIHNE